MTNFKFTDESCGKCFECHKGTYYKLIRETDTIELSQGRFATQQNAESWCCDTCGEEISDPQMCLDRENAIRAVYPDYFRK